MKKVILLPMLILLIFINTNKNIYAQNAKAIASLNNEEQKVMDYIDANMPRAIALLKESVNINSGTLNIAGVKKWVKYLHVNLKKPILKPSGSRCLIPCAVQVIWWRP